MPRSTTLLRSFRLTRWQRALAAGSVLSLVAASYQLTSSLPQMTLVAQLHTAAGEHLQQTALLSLIQQGQQHAAFDLAFEHGDELFETPFNALDGVGANVGDGQRFTRMPRADKTGPMEWANHLPSRTTGPNATACNACHSQPSDDGAGGSVHSVIRDPLHTGNPDKMIQRSTTHLFGLGALQRLAEEMTVDLHAIRAALVAQVLQTGNAANAPLVTKGIAFGSLRAKPPLFGSQVRLDFRDVEGVADDLVVRPFQWKGSVASLRDFNRGAAHNELGMQPVELVGNSNDADGDGIVDEMSVGDVTALVIYLAAQPRPTTRRELASHGVIPALTPMEIAAVTSGEAVFASIGCASCHRASLLLQDPIFREPSNVPAFRDTTFPGSQNPVAVGVRPDFPVRFDLTADQPDNVLTVGGQTVYLGCFTKNAAGAAIVGLYGDLKRHRMGQQLAESIDEVDTGASTFLTENLWGCGSTAPYMHDGRATTLTEAILAHGGEANGSRQQFVALPLASKQNLIAFLEDLVLWKSE